MLKKRKVINKENGKEKKKEFEDNNKFVIIQVHLIMHSLKYFMNTNNFNYLRSTTKVCLKKYLNTWLSH